MSTESNTPPEVNPEGKDVRPKFRVSEKALGGKAMPWIVWALRIAVGAVFVLSGLVKAIDPWGTVFKFEEYFMLWHIAVPQELTVVLAMVLCSAEFLLGVMLSLGCYRRSSVGLLLMIMAVMLPLTAYIWVSDPVADCGCFGDFLRISNGATFFKNIVITAALVYLVPANRRVSGLINPYLQWIAGAVCLVFAVCVELYGLVIQPLVDFRSFPEGRELAAEDEDSDIDEDFIFTYEKEGVDRDFRSDSLPDSTWTFVDRRVAGATTPRTDNLTELTIYDEEDSDVTADVISSEGPEVLVIVPDSRYARMNIPVVWEVLDRAMGKAGGSAVLITDLNDSRIASLRDVFAPDMPVYRAESTVLKELSRGNESLILLIDGKIRMKRNLVSVMLDFDRLASSDNPVATLSALKPAGASDLRNWAGVVVAVLLLLIVASQLPALLNNSKKAPEAENNSVTLQNGDSAEPDSADATPTDRN